MKAPKNSIIIFILFVLINTVNNAQNSIIGTLENYTNNEGFLTNYDMINRRQNIFWNHK